LKSGVVTAIIEDIKVGQLDYHNELMMSATFNMNGTACTLSFTMTEAYQMMKDVKLYSDLFDLNGLPCEINIDDKNTCHFLGMWKRS
jgi:hypothetical protein